MRKTITVLLAFAFTVALVPTFDVVAAWKNVQIATGVYVCQDDATGAQFKPPYAAKADVTKACNVLTSFEPWLLTADAAPILKTLNANPDNTRNTQYPCLAADQSDCKAPAGTSLAWTQACLDTALAMLPNAITGTPVDYSIDSCLTGTNAAAATITFVQTADGTTSCFADFTITGSSPNRKLHNAATAAGTGFCKLKATFSGNSVLSNSYPWTNTAPPPTDTTPPTQVTQLTCSSGAVLSSVCTIDGQMDPDDGVARTGIASYKFYSGGVLAGTLAAASAGLTVDFTPGKIGTVPGSPSATQGSGATGAQWTVNFQGEGFDGAADSYSGTIANVSGSQNCGIARIDSIPNVLTYNKAPIDQRNSISGTAAHYATVIMRIGSSYYVQRNIRTSDGAAQSNTSAVQIPISPPFWEKNCVTNNLGSFSYSADGTTWTLVLSNEAITLNDPHIMVFGGSTTTTGADTASGTVVYGSIAVQTTGTLSKSLTLAAGTQTITATSVDVQGNESTALPGVSISVAASGGQTKKWTPGHTVQAHAAHGSYCGTGCDAYRHNLYPIYLGCGSQCNAVKATQLWVVWKYLESDTGNDFSAGFSWLHNEINYVKATYPGKLVELLIYFDPYGQGTDNASQIANYPTYLVNAGCTFDQSPGKPASLGFHIDDPTCRSYMKRLVAAYGAEFDSEPAFYAIRLDQETDSVMNNAARDTGWRDLAQATATAFPTSNVIVPLNWMGVDSVANKEAMIVYLNSIHVMIMTPDTRSTSDMTCAQFPSHVNCILSGMTGSGHVYCGEIASTPAIELSGQGYNSQGNYTSQQVVNVWNSNEECAQHGVWDLNNNETGSSDTQYFNGAHGQLWAINGCGGACALTHSSKPSGYP